MTTNITQPNRLKLVGRLRRFLPLLRIRIFDQLVIKALMRPFGMIMISVLRAEHIHMLMAEYNKMVQAFLADTLDKTLDEGDRIG